MCNWPGERAEGKTEGRTGHEKKPELRHSDGGRFSKHLNHKRERKSIGRKVHETTETRKKTKAEYINMPKQGTPVRDLRKPDEPPKPG